MSNLFDGPTPPKLKAITVNGAIIVESEEEAKKKAEKRKERRSRWDQTSRNAAPNLKGAKVFFLIQIYENISKIQISYKFLIFFFRNQRRIRFSMNVHLYWPYPTSYTQVENDFPTCK